MGEERVSDKLFTIAEQKEKSNQLANSFEILQLVRCLSALIHGTSASKLMWIFNLYDTEGDGVIDKTEMLKVVQSIYNLLGKHTDPPYEEASVKEHMEFVFSIKQSPTNYQYL
ncbi:hypothetical protein ACTXT7_000581 [Hymenolepis weldensis]